MSFRGFPAEAFEFFEGLEADNSKAYWTDHKADYLRRLRRIEGQVRGIHRMVDEDEYCIDILRQTYAVRKALENLEALILEGHLRTCVPAGIKGDRGETVIKELIQLYTITRNQ